MSMKVEIDHIDAELLCLLKQAKASRVMNWDTSIREGVTLKIHIDYGLTDVIPQSAFDAINRCIADCVSAFKVTP